MQPKILLIALSAAAFSSCSTAYKSGQTPDDVYYSPAKIVDEERNNDRREEVRYEPAVDYQISMSVRDRRWRDFRDDYDYDNSPYNYTCKKYNYGYYYNPRYYPWAIYTGKTGYSKPVNTTPRMVNLAAYKGYYNNVANDKTFNSNADKPASRYNNSNSRVGNLIREVITPSNNNSSSNSSRSYTPSSSSGSSSSGSSSSGSVSRPGRGH